MLEIIPYIILILIIIALELTQIACSKFKIGKWILPILSFLFSLYIMGFLISFEIGDSLGPVENVWEVLSLGTLMMFPVLNIPTIMFWVTNVVVKRLNMKGC